MSLTYQPFAEAPEIKEWRSDLAMNIPASERLGSVLIGLGLVAATVSLNRAGRLVLVGMGAALIWRGLAGHCPWYDGIGLDRRHAG